jgi:hypothetical protein
MPDPVPSDALQSQPSASLGQRARHSGLKLFRLILSHIPSTDAFNARKDKRIQIIVEGFDERLEGLYDHGPGLYEKSVVRVVVWEKLATSDFWKEEIRRAMVAIFVVLILASLVISPIFVAHWAHFHQEWSQWLQFEAASAFFACLIGGIIILPAILVNDLEMFYFESPVLTVGTALVMTLFAFWGAYRLFPRGSIPMEHSKAVLLSAVLTCCVVAVLSFATLFIVTNIYALLEGRKRRMEPHACIVDSLSRAYSCATDKSTLWISQFRRRTLAETLENAAQCLELYLPQRLGTRDATTDAWLKSEFESRASAIRELEKDILLSRIDLADALGGRLKDLVLHAIRFEWDAFPTADPEKLTPREKISSRAIAALHALLLAAIPLALLLLIRRPGSPIQLTGESLNWTRLVLFAWMIVSLIPIIDPDYSATSKAATLLGQFRDLLRRDNQGSKPEKISTSL